VPIILDRLMMPAAYAIGFLPPGFVQCALAPQVHACHGH